MSVQRFMAIVFAMGLVISACGGMHGKVPKDAFPAGYKGLIGWDSCGASGEYCSQVIILGSNDVAFSDAAKSIKERFDRKGWQTRYTPDVSLSLSQRADGSGTCVLLTPFRVDGDIHPIEGPTRERLIGLAGPFKFLIEATGSPTCG